MAGFEGKRISTPLPVEYFRFGQVILILINSRRQSVTYGKKPERNWMRPARCVID